MMVRRMSVSQFRTAIRAIVSSAENGVPTILTHYKRDAVAIVPMSMFHAQNSSDRKNSSLRKPSSKKIDAS
jgi:hypothetical protein